MLYTDMGQYADAQKEYDLILASGDTSMTQTALNNRMSLHHRSHDHRSCVQAGRALQAIGPLEDFQSFWMASAFDSLGQRDSACLYYHRAAALGHSEAKVLLAQCQ